RARWRAMAALGKPEDERRHDAFEVADDVLRYRGTLAMMRPLAEGMALFAEHDLYPGEAQIISPIALYCAALFGPRALEGEELRANVGTLIASYRLSEKHIRRKADLLLQGLSCDDGGYLPGYLTVKSLHAIAARDCEAFFDSEFFLHYLRCWFYDDWDFVD